MIKFDFFHNQLTKFAILFQNHLTKFTIFCNLLSKLLILFCDHLKKFTILELIYKILFVGVHVCVTWLSKFAIFSTTIWFNSQLLLFSMILRRNSWLIPKIVWQNWLSFHKQMMKFTIFSMTDCQNLWDFSWSVNGICSWLYS